MGFLDTIRGRSVTGGGSGAAPRRGDGLLAPDAGATALTSTQREEQGWRAEIARDEWLVQHVPAREDHSSPAFQYTAGLTERGLPEIIVYGLRMKTGTLVLDDLAHRLLNGDEFPDGMPVPELVRGDARAQLWDVTWLQDHLDVVRRLYGTLARVRQLVVSDADGRLPWEDGYLDPHLQPVLFVPPNGRGPRRTDPVPARPASGPFIFDAD